MLGYNSEQDNKRHAVSQRQAHPRWGQARGADAEVTGSLRVAGAQKRSLTQPGWIGGGAEQGVRGQADSFQKKARKRKEYM